MAILDKFPIWAVYLATVAAVLVAAEIGFRIGIWLKQRHPSSEGTPMTGAVVGGMLGLMAFLLAFAIGIVIGQHNGRKEMVVVEANAVGTAYLRAGFLDEPDRTSVRDLLREYVEVRLAAAADPALLESTVTRSEQIHGELWSIVEDNVHQGRESDIMALFAESINEVIDVHSLRRAAIELRLPRAVGMVLFIATVLSFLLVGVASSSDRKRDPFTILLFALALVAVLMIVVDLDRPQQGLLTVSQAELSALLQQMTAPAP
jgi:UDP-N-acetylmuramyl pentapeptide phosphotransferase/UDP-N-acetylglucosamine-1-phosphate transferase